MKMKLHIPKTILLLCVLLLFAGTASAADVSSISPSVSLSFSGIPSGLVSGGGADIRVLSGLTPEITGALAGLAEFRADNAAYAVSITPKGFTAQDVASVVIRLPVLPAWSSAHPDIKAVVITGGTASYVPVSLIGINEKDQIVFEVRPDSLPETVLLVSAVPAPADEPVVPAGTAAPAGTGTPEPEPARTPVPVLGMLLGCSAAALLIRRA
jgi:hypothetical protein